MRCLVRRALTLTLFLILAGSAGLHAQDDPCKSDKTFSAFAESLTEQVSAKVKGEPAKATAKAAATADMKETLAGRANADGLTGDRLDLLHRAFVALGLGQVEEKEGQLIFNFNPEVLKLDMGQFSPRVIVHKPVLFSALSKQIDKLPVAVRQSTKEAFEKDLGDLDDLEAQLRWTNASGTPDAIIQELASAIFQPAYEEAAQKIMISLGVREAELRELIAQDLAVAIPAVGATPVSKICSVPAAKEHFLQIVAEIRGKGEAGLKTMGDSLTKAHFFDLADLIDGEPHWSVEADYRRRADAAGPDSRSASLRYEFGNISFRDYKSWAKKNEKAIGAASVQEYLESQAARKALPKFSLSVDYSSSPELRTPLVPGSPDFVQPDASKISAVARGGLYFGGGRDRRLELDATYDDVRDDPARQDRLVVKLSWVEKLSNLAQTVAGSDLVVTLVYASKPEFLGDVDKELGMRFGLKWSLGDGK